MSGLERFRIAQDHPRSGFDAALAEIQAGRKRGHWIWYIFPQIAGLGMSSASRTYAIRDAAEAQAYLRDSTLRSRLTTITTAVADQLSQGMSIDRLMGSSIDAQKLVSSLTLFGEVARGPHAGEGSEACQSLADLADRILDAAERQGYPRCPFTLSTLAGRAQP
jgi:uncharacterized protein (DUF1810 family)